MICNSKLRPGTKSPEQIPGRKRIPKPEALSLVSRELQRIRLFALLILAIVVQPAPANTKTHLPPIFRITTADMEAEQIGTELGRQWKQHFPDLEQRYDHHLAKYFSQQHFDQMLTERVKPIVATGVPSQYLKELRGLASALQLVARNRLGDGLLSMDELTLAQFLPDFDHYSKSYGFGVYGSRAGSAGTVVAYQIDLPGGSKDTLASLAAITIYKGAKRTVVNIGTAGSLGLTAGFNDRGLFMAHLASPLERDTMAPSTKNRAVSFALRQALEEYTSVDPAAAALRRRQYVSSQSVLLADRGRVVVLEQPRAEAARLRQANSVTRAEMAWNRPEQIAVVNCFVLANTPANCRDLQDRYRWQYLRTQARFEPQGPRAELADVIEIMPGFRPGNSNRPGQNPSRAITFAPGTTELYVYTGGQGEALVMNRYDNLLGQRSRLDFSAEPLQIGIFILLIVFLVAIVWIRRNSRTEV